MEFTMTTDNAKPGMIRLFFSGLWSAFNGIRRVVFGVLALLILFVAIKGFSGGASSVEPKSVLVINLNGALVEQFSGDAQELAIAQALGEENLEVRVRDVKKALDYAAKDLNIARVLLRVDATFSAGQAGMREVTDALIAFKKDSGKEVIAYGNGYSQKGLFIAAAADKVFLNPDGIALMEGVGRMRTYYKTALDNLGVKVNVFRVGKYKSFAEPYLLDGPSADATEADLNWMNDVWDRYLTEYAAMRKITGGAAGLKLMLEELPQRLAAVGGDAAKLALSEKLVDELKTPDQLRDLLIKNGATITDPENPGRMDFRKVSMTDYLGQKIMLNPLDTKANAVAVIVAEGSITDGKAPQGQIGGESTALLVKKARENPAIKALVLRVNSPGGSGFASEMIRREIEVTRSAGKPVYISMGDVAASGGYWISMASDGIFATPSTITGSIGIFAIIPNAAEALDKIGVHSGGSSTTWLAAAGDPTAPLDPRFADTMQTLINHGYQNFIGKVAAARKKTPEQINEIAQGRVWTGAQAKKLGLVDQMGDLDDAIKAAAAKASLGTNFVVRYVENEPEGFAALLQSFSAKAVRATAQAVDSQSLVSNVFGSRATLNMRDDLAFIRQAQSKPFATYAHCFCEIR
jgi:protease IV